MLFSRKTFIVKKAYNVIQCFSMAGKCLNPWHNQTHFAIAIKHFF